MVVAASFAMAFVAALAQALPNGAKVSTSVDTCHIHTITKYRPGFGAGSTLPTTTRTSARTVHSTITTCASQSTTTSTITPDPVTSTVYANGGKHRLENADERCTSTTTM